MRPKDRPHYLAREDLGAGLEGDPRSANRVVRAWVAGEAWRRGDTDFPAVRKDDAGSARADGQAAEVIGAPDVTGEQGRVRKELGVGCRLDEVADVGRVAVIPTGGQRGSSAEAEVVSPPRWAPRGSRVRSRSSAGPDGRTTADMRINGR